MCSMRWNGSFNFRNHRNIELRKSATLELRIYGIKDELRAEGKLI